VPFGFGSILAGRSAASDSLPALYPLMVGLTGQCAIWNLERGDSVRTTLTKYLYLRRSSYGLKQRVLSNGKKSSVLQDAAALTTQLAAGLEKIGLAMKSRTWRREGRAGLARYSGKSSRFFGPSLGQRAQVSTVANELAVRLPTASEVIATLERKQLVSTASRHERWTGCEWRS